jgi:hypothetical protein
MTPEALSSLGLTRLRNSANLLHHAQGVVVSPGLHDLAAFYVIYGDARNLHRVAARRNAHKLPLVPAACPPACDHLIPLGYQVLDGHLDFGEGVTVDLDELLGTLHAATDALRASGVVDDQVGGHYLIYEVHIPFVIDLIHKASGQGLLLFRRHARARLVRAIEGLGEQERVVTTFYYEGLTLREIGRVLDLTEGRISQMLHSALVRLRQNLAEESRLSERT